MSTQFIATDLQQIMFRSPHKTIAVQLVVDGLQHHLEPFTPHSLEAGLSHSLIQLLPEIERLCHIPCRLEESNLSEFPTLPTPIPPSMEMARYTVSDLHLLLKTLEEEDCSSDARCALDNLRQEIHRLLA